MDQVVKTYADQVRAKLADRVVQIILFGSHARGDAQAGSDYDMLLVVDRRSPELRPVILEIEREVLDQYGVLVATVLRSAEEWDMSQRFPFGRNVVREGVTV